MPTAGRSFFLAFKHEHSMCQQMGCSESHSVSKDAAFG